jgi:hypothetical protein
MDWMSISSTLGSIGISVLVVYGIVYVFNKYTKPDGYSQPLQEKNEEENVFVDDQIPPFQDQGIQRDSKRKKVKSRKSSSSAAAISASADLMLTSESHVESLKLNRKNSTAARDSSGASRKASEKNLNSIPRNPVIDERIEENSPDVKPVVERKDSKSFNCSNSPRKQSNSQKISDLQINKLNDDSELEKNGSLMSRTSNSSSVKMSPKRTSRKSSASASGSIQTAITDTSEERSSQHVPGLPQISDIRSSPKALKRPTSNSRKDSKENHQSAKALYFEEKTEESIIRTFNNSGQFGKSILTNQNNFDVQAKQDIQAQIEGDSVSSVSEVGIPENMPRRLAIAHEKNQAENPIEEPKNNIDLFSPEKSSSTNMIVPAQTSPTSNSKKTLKPSRSALASPKKKNPSLDLSRKLTDLKNVYMDNNNSSQNFEAERIRANFEKRSSVINELIATEKNYVGKLECLIKDYLIPLAETKDPDALQISSGPDVIVKLHRLLLDKLEKVPPYADNQLVIAEIFEKHGQFFKMYSTFLATYEQRMAKIALLKKRDNCKHVFAEAKRKGVEAIESLMINPVQRIPRYILILKEILKYTDECTPAYEKLKAVYDQVEKVCASINQDKAQNDSVSRIADLHEAIKDKFDQVIAPGRKLIREDEVKILKSGGFMKKYSDIILFLFNDMVLWTSKKSGKFKGMFYLNGDISLKAAEESSSALYELEVELVDCIMVIDAKESPFGPRKSVPQISNNFELHLFFEEDDERNSWLESFRGNYKSRRQHASFFQSLTSKTLSSMLISSPSK